MISIVGGLRGLKTFSIYFFKNLLSLGALTAVPSSFGPRKSKMKTRIQCNINSKILMPVKFQ